VPYPSEAFGIFSAPFQWIELPESETLVLVPEVPENQKHQKKPEVPENQKHQSRNPQVKFEGVKFGFSEI
jgi:hypothetical protein